MDSRQGFNDEQKQHMVLNSASDNGMRITGTYACKQEVCCNYESFSTVKSFLELVPLLLKIECVTAFLSGKLSQDPLENFFGIQRQQGRANGNRSIDQVILFFAWANQRDKVCFIFHKVAKVLYGK